MVEAIVQRPELSSLGGHRYDVLRLPPVKEEAPKPCVRYLATAEIRSLHPLTVLCKAGGDIFFGNAAARHLRSLKVRQSPIEIRSEGGGSKNKFVLPCSLSVHADPNFADDHHGDEVGRSELAALVSTKKSLACYAMLRQGLLHRFPAGLGHQRDWQAPASTMAELTNSERRRDK